VEEHKYAHNIKGAKKFIERNRPEVWEFWKRLFSAARFSAEPRPDPAQLGIQAFEPVLIEGSAIQLHPLVTTSVQRGL
jgi:DNA-directed RNA polymerase subunit beta'